MKIDDREITARLNGIRLRLGVGLSDFIPRPFPERVDMDLATPEEVEALFHPSNILIHEGRPAMVYIRDHTVGKYPDDPAKRRRLHFTVCQTLESMKRVGRFKRYRLTSRDNNRYLVDIRGKSGRAQELDDQILYPCMNCLANVFYHDYNLDMSDAEKTTIVQGFEAKEAYRLLQRYFDIFRRHTSMLKSAREPSGYTEDWEDISRAYRLPRKFTCEDEECGVDLRRYPHLTDAHHIDGDKQNNDWSNLLCLCKLCHAIRHPHYHVSEDHRRIIEKMREGQGIFL